LNYSKTLDFGGEEMKKIILAACTIFVGVSLAYAEDAVGRQKRDLDLTLYSLVGISVFTIDGANQDSRYEDISDNPIPLVVGAGFFMQIGDRFAYGADYMYGQKGGFRIIESPMYIQYTAARIGPLNIAPQVGFTFGNAQITTFEPGGTDWNASVINSNYFTGRIGLAANLRFRNGLFLGLKGGYNVPFQGVNDWTVRGTDAESGLSDRLSQLHFDVTFGTTKSLVGRD
jgi:hypothetical protein